MRSLLALAALPALAAASPSYHYQLDGARSQVSAKVSYMGLGSKTARFPAMRGAIRLVPEHLEEIDLDVVLDAAQMTAGSNSDTAYLRGPDFFDVAHFPAVSFSGHRMTMTGPTAARIDGQITARGVTRPCTLVVTFRDPPAQISGRAPIELTGVAAINRREFGMTAYPMVVGKKVTITITARLVPG